MTRECVEMAVLGRGPLELELDAVRWHRFLSTVRFGVWGVLYRNSVEYKIGVVLRFAVCRGGALFDVGVLRAGPCRGTPHNS